MTSHVREFLLAKQVRSLIPSDRSLITLSLTDTIDSVISTFSTHRILTAPVLNESKEYVTCFGYHDILHSFAADVRNTARHESWRNIDLEQVNLDIQLKDLPKSEENASAYVLVADSSSVLDLLFIFSKKPQTRALLVNEVNAVWNVVSATDIIRFLSKSIDSARKEISSFFDIDLMDMNEVIEETPILTLLHEETVLHAIRALEGNETDAIAVVDESHRLIGNFSISDLRGVKYEDSETPFLVYPIREFLGIHSVKSLSPYKTIESVTLRKVIHIFSDCQIHNIWKVDLEEKPVGVIRMRDVVAVIAHKLAVA